MILFHDDVTDLNTSCAEPGSHGFNIIIIIIIIWFDFAQTSDDFGAAALSVCVCLCLCVLLFIHDLHTASVTLKEVHGEDAVGSHALVRKQTWRGICRATSGELTTEEQEGEVEREVEKTFKVGREEAATKYLSGL